MKPSTAIASSLLIGVTVCAAPVPSSGTQIDWRTSPLDLNLRGLNGERFRFLCPPGKAPAGQPVGSGPYTDGSSICAAAAHAGVLRPSVGGNVLIEIRSGQSHFASSLSNYIQSSGYEAYWDGSFVVIREASSLGVNRAAARTLITIGMAK
jgi:hypothetical protein